ncbi:MAG TPA: hypothetical protein DCQ52_13815 [Acidimicrobiaceae bacterium]|jgi:hypothetical protein|nr:hypothetical protein [Acidimicrobiaceae bacterium]
MAADRSENSIRPGDAWCSRTEREYFITVIRPASQPGRWIVSDGGTRTGAGSAEPTRSTSPNGK